VAVALRQHAAGSTFVPLTGSDFVVVLNSGYCCCYYYYYFVVVVVVVVGGLISTR